MGVIGTATNGIIQKRNAVAKVNSTEHGRHNADVCFTTGEDEVVNALVLQSRVQPTIKPRRIYRFVKYEGGRHECLKLGHQIHKFPGRCSPVIIHHFS